MFLYGWEPEGQKSPVESKSEGLKARATKLGLPTHISPQKWMSLKLTETLLART